MVIGTREPEKESFEAAWYCMMISRSPLQDGGMVIVTRTVRVGGGLMIGDSNPHLLKWLASPWLSAVSKCNEIVAVLELDSARSGGLGGRTPETDPSSRRRKPSPLTVRCRRDTDQKCEVAGLPREIGLHRASAHVSNGGGPERPRLQTTMITGLGSRCRLVVLADDLFGLASRWPKRAAIVLPPSSALRDMAGLGPRSLRVLSSPYCR